MTAIYAVTFVMSAVLICKWTLSYYDDDDDDDDDDDYLVLNFSVLHFQRSRRIADHQGQMLGHRVSCVTRPLIERAATRVSDSDFGSRAHMKALSEI